MRAGSKAGSDRDIDRSRGDIYLKTGGHVSYRTRDSRPRKAPLGSW